MYSIKIIIVVFCIIGFARVLRYISFGLVEKLCCSIIDVLEFMVKLTRKMQIRSRDGSKSYSDIYGWRVC